MLVFVSTDLLACIAPCRVLLRPRTWASTRYAVATSPSQWRPFGTEPESQGRLAGARRNYKTISHVVSQPLSGVRASSYAATRPLSNLQRWPGLGGCAATHTILRTLLQGSQSSSEPPAYRGQEIQVQRLDTIARPMVMWVAHIGRVRDHYCRVSEVPERGVIATPRVGKDPTAERNRKELARDVVADPAGEARHLRQGS